MRAAFAVALWLAFAVQAGAGPMVDPYDIVEQTGPIYEAEGVVGVHRFLEGSIRRARTKGVLTADWAVVFMMLADSIRNTRENAAYALRISDEGLELARTGTAEDQEMAVLLEVSRAYILADLGRFEEAVSTAILALPMYQKSFGAEAVAAFRQEVEIWASGQGTNNSYAADAVALRVLAEADSAFDRGEYGTMLTLAARAVLPLDAGVAPEALARSNAKAGLLRGQALFQLGQMPAALAALEHAANLAAPGWEKGLPEWQFPPQEAAPLPADLFFWLGRAAAFLDAQKQAQTALALADSLTTEPRARNTLLFARITLMAAMGQSNAAIAELRQASQSTTPDLADQAALAGFYAELMQAHQATAVAELAPDALFAAAEAAIAQDRPGSSVSAAFVQSEAAPFLLLAGQTQRALGYARAAFAAGQNRLDTTGDSDSGRLAAQKAARGVIDTLLDAAYVLDSASAGAVCGTTEGKGCVMIVQRHD